MEKTKQTIDTVNVIKVNNAYPQIDILGSFLETPLGNEEAETLFTKTCIEKVKEDSDEQLTDDDIDCLLDDGYYQSGEIVIYIIHSMNEDVKNIDNQ